MTYTPRSSMAPALLPPGPMDAALPLTSLVPGMLLIPLTVSQVLPRRLALQLGELLEQRARFFRQGGRHGNFDGHEQVAPGVGPRATTPPHPEGLTGLRPRRDLELDLRAVERRHIDLGPQRRLGDGHGHLQREVVAPPTEERMRRHADPDVEVAGLASGRRRAALGRQTDPVAVVDAGGDPHLEVALPRRVVDGQVERRALERLGERDRRLPLDVGSLAGRPSPLTEHTSEQVLEPPCVSTPGEEVAQIEILDADAARTAGEGAEPHV